MYTLKKESVFFRRTLYSTMFATQSITYSWVSVGGTIALVGVEKYIVLKVVKSSTASYRMVYS